jgi:hypothetical protein
MSKEFLSLPFVDSRLGRAAEVALAEADLPKLFMNPSPRVLLLLRLVTKDRASSSCSKSSVTVSSVSQGAGEWKRIVGPRKLNRGSGSSSSGGIDSGEGLRSRRMSVVTAVSSVPKSRLPIAGGEKDLIVSNEGRAYCGGITKSN